MQADDMSDRREEFNPRIFWNNHDLALSDHEKQQDATLSHDLYRGMPSWFNAHFSYFQKKAFSDLLAKLNFLVGDHVLDLGCGTGRWTGEMLSLGYKTVGVDLGFQALFYASKKWNQAKFCNVMLPDLCFAPETFRLSISVTVLQHIPYSQQLNSLNAVCQTLKPEGYLIVCETIDVTDPSPHLFGNSYEDWIGLFNQAGFELIATKGCEYFPIAKIFRYMRKVLPTNLDKGKKANVTDVANRLNSNPFIACLVHLAIWVAYPVEVVLSHLLPTKMANKVFFLLRKA